MSWLKKWRRNRLIIRRSKLIARHAETADVMSRLVKFPAYYANSLIDYKSEIAEIDAKLQLMREGD